MVVVTVSVTLPSLLVVVDDVDSALIVVPVDSIVVAVFPSAAIGSDVVVPFGATGVAEEVPVDSVVAVPVDSVVVAPVEATADSVVVPADSVEAVPVAAVPVVSVEVVPVVDSVVVAPSLEDAPLSVAEPVVPSVEDDVAPEASPCASLEDAPSVDVASDDVPSEEDVLLPDSLEVPSEDAESLPDSLATLVFSFKSSARAVIGDAMTAALKVAAAIPISFE